MKDNAMKPEKLLQRRTSVSGKLMFFYLKLSTLRRQIISGYDTSTAEPDYAQFATDDFYAKGYKI